MTKSQNAVKYVSAINYKSDRRTSIAETLKNVAIITLNLPYFTLAAHELSKSPVPSRTLNRCVACR